jgi:REP element-mobilizing transposase RayT
MSADKFQDKYRIPSARATWWDYSANGCYFITICTANRDCIFGEIIDNNKTDDTIANVETHGRASLHHGCAFLQLSPIGEIVLQEWKKSFEMRAELFCDAFVIMPNHIHALLRIDNPQNNDMMYGRIVETHGRASLQRPPKSISSFVGGFKSSATKRINEYRNTQGTSVWQTRFHDHIIRNNDEYQHIEDYIILNPNNWLDDKFYTE